MAGEPSDDLRAFTPGGDPTVCVVHTLEFRHPAFVDDNNNPAPARVAHSYEPFEGTLESDAPMNAGETVTFQPLAFTARLPEQGENANRNCELVCANAARVLTPYLEKATLNPAPINVTYRQYLSSAPGVPGWVVGGLTIKNSRAETHRVTATAGFEDLINKPHPKRLYTVREFPGLDR